MNTWHPKAARAPLGHVLPVLLGVLLTPPALAEPEKFDWRLIAGDATPPAEQHAPQASRHEPNPVVLPIVQDQSEVESKSDAGWHWIRPQVAENPGSGSGRTAVQLAETEQERDLAARQNMLDGILPGHLSGLAPLAVESGIEFRF